MSKSSRINIFYDSIYMLPLCLVAVFFLIRYTSVPDQKLLSYVPAVIILIECLWARHCDNHFRFIPLLLTALVGVCRILFLPRSERLPYIQSHTWVFLLLVAAVGVFVLVRLMTRSHILRRILLVGILAGLLMLLYFKIEIHKAIFALCLVPLLAGISEEIQLRWKKSGDISGQRHLVSIAPFLILTCMLVMVFPNSEKPFDWSFTVKIWQQAVDFVARIENAFTGGDDYDGRVGFSEKTSFLGKVLKSGSKEVMSVDFGVYSGNRVYLKGKTFDRFDGHEWKSTVNTDAAQQQEELQEKLSRITAADVEDIDDYLRKSELKITYLDFRTKYLFVPLDGTAYHTVPENLKFENTGSEILSSKQLGRSTRYYVSYYRLNQDSKEFRQLISELSDRERSSTPSPETSSETKLDETGTQIQSTQGQPLSSSKKNAGDSGTDSVAITATSAESESAADSATSLSAEDSKETYREILRKNYLPKTDVSERTRSYLSEETKGLSSDYEKLLHLEKILSSMKYTLSPGEIPEEVKSEADYLDYFLFEKQEGYCIHYATAFVLMARSLGIPARFVQGYYVKRSGSGETIVTSNMAHAWPEAYIEGLGWLSFEPTPGHKNASYWDTSSEKKENDGKNYYGQNPYVSHPDGGVTTISSTRNTGKKQTFLLKKRILLPLVYGFVLLILIGIFCRLLSGQRYRKMADGDRFRVACKRNEKLLRYAGFTIEPGETLQEFRTRIADQMPEEAVAYTLRMESVFYGDCAVDPSMVTLAEDNRKMIWEQIRKQEGRVRYLLLRIRSYLF
uniref:Transglutaminase-like enzyme, predicted cysteine protease n=1 Tax=Eubacterium cellulosolvens (strain ATCC 43171 / JCM 9499 / 6) TaxID=633697 RepID=I5AWF9_EUBC6